MRRFNPATALALACLGIGGGQPPSPAVAGEPKTPPAFLPTTDKGAPPTVSGDDLTRAVADLKGEVRAPPDLRKYFQASVRLRGLLGDLRTTTADRANLTAWLPASGGSTGTTTVSPKRPKFTADPPAAEKPVQGPENPTVDPAEFTKRRLLKDWQEIDPLARRAEHGLLVLDRALVEAKAEAEVNRAFDEVEAAVTKLTSHLGERKK